MYLDRLLYLISIIAWALVLFILAVSFIRDVRYRGLKVAFRNILSLRTAFFLSILLAVTILSAALVFIPPQERGVVISILAPQGVREQPLSPGLRFIVPLAEQVVTYPIYWQTYTMADRPLEGQVLGDDAITARTTDGQSVIINGSVIFRLDPQQVVRIHIDWQDRYIDELIRPRTRGLIRDGVAKFTVDEVNSIQRTNLELELDRELREILEEHGFLLETFVLRNITFSDQYGSSVEQKQVQEQGQVTSLYEAEQIRRIANGRADAVVLQAQADAMAIKVKAQAQADARIIQAEAEAEAHVVEARARAEGLRLVNQALEENPETLLTYQYINRLSPNIKALLLPSNTPLVLPLPGDLLTGPTAEGTSPPATEETSQPEDVLLPQEDLSTAPITQTSTITTTGVLTPTAPVTAP